VRYDVLHPQKATVLRELTKALNDPKRAVRKEAVDARSVYTIPSRCLSAYSTPNLQDKLVYVLRLERRAHIISRLNETARDREEQVRELLKYEREFQRIAGEVGGSDALASLDALENTRGALADASSSSSSTSASAPAPSSAHESTRATRHLDPVTEEEPSFTHDWEVDPDTHLQHDGDPDGHSADLDLDLDLDGMGSSGTSPQRLLCDFAAASATSANKWKRSNTRRCDPPLGAPAHAHGVASLDKLGGWRRDLDSAGRSRLRIERWEADGDVEGVRHIDGRDVVAEHLREFERVLFEANAKAQAIMAPA
jgi:hypothetical protein